MSVPPPRPRLVLPALLLAGLAGAALPAAPASAGTYTVRYCEEPNPAGLPDWKPNSGNHVGYVTESCRQGGPMQIDGSQIQRVEQSASLWEVEAPDGLSIADFVASANVSMQWGSGTGRYGGYSVYMRLIGAKQSGCGPLVGRNSYCGVGGFYRLDAGAGADGKRAVIGVECEPETTVPASGFCEGSVFVRVSTNQITWRDSTAPTGTVSAGTLLNTGFGAPAAGTATVHVSASDVGSGVQRLEARVDGQPVARTSDRCQQPYVRAEPCPPSIADDLAVDTSKIANGTHDLEVVAVDASGTEGVIDRRKLVVDNGGAVGPGTDMNLRGAPNGPYAGDDAQLSAWWPSTARAASKKRSVRKRCKASKTYVRKHSIACNGRAPGSSMTTGYSAERGDRFRGRLARPDGSPIAGAQVQVTATVAGKATPLGRRRPTPTASSPRCCPSGTDPPRLPLPGTRVSATPSRPSR